jgi:microsomal dipeptidase-like Zn-dependent dipeptidase
MLFHYMARDSSDPPGPSPPPSFLARAGAIAKASASTTASVRATLPQTPREMIEDNMDYLDSFYRRGVRYMTLTWNNSTPWATSALDETSKAFVVTPYGLTHHLQS